MRRFLSGVAASVVAVPLLAVLPVAQVPGRAARPVAPSLWHVALKGVDRAEALAERAPLTRPGAVQGLPPAGGPTTAGSPAVLTSRMATRTFQTLGVTWDVGARSAESADSAEAVAVQVRWRAAKGQPSAGTWSTWTAVEADADLPREVVPGPVAVRAGTDPLWTGPADGVQVRVDVAGGVAGGKAPAGLRLELIDPGASPHDAHVDDVPPAAAAAASGMPGIHRRADWGADESKLQGGVTYMPSIRAGVLHHTAGMNGYSASQVPAIIRGDYAYHLSRGWNDIGYNVLVDRFGRLWEGRAGGLDKAVRGAHAAGFNQDTVGVSVLGNYETAHPSSAVVDAIARVFAWKFDLHHRDPLGKVRLTSDSGDGTSRHPAGETVTLPTIVGHRDVGWTACPGRYLYPLMARIRARTVQFMRTALVDVALSARSVPQGSGVSVSATALAAMSWRWQADKLCTGTSGGAVAGTTRGRARVRAAWTGRLGSAPVRAGVYRLTLSGSSAGGAARAVTTDATVLPPASAAMPGDSTVVASGGVVPVTPARLLDTRAGSVPALGPGNRLEVQVGGRGGVPASGAAAAILSVTSVCPSAPGYLSVVPTGSVQPWLSLADHPTWTTTAATAVVPLSSAGRVSLRNSAGITDVVVDVVGYVAAASTSRAVVATTPPVLGARTQPIAAGATLALAVPGVEGPSASRTGAAWVDLRVKAGRAGMLQLAGPAGTFTASQAVGHPVGNSHHLVLAPVRGGQVLLRNAGPAAIAVTAQLVAVQTTAPPSGEAFTALGATWRALTSAPVTGAGFILDVTVGGGPVPGGAPAVLAVVTASAPTGNAALSVGADGAPAPADSVLEVAAGTTTSNLVLLPLAADGRVVLRASGAPVTATVDVVARLG